MANAHVFLGLEAGDWAAWASAAGTFAAAAVALWMARRDGKRNAREAYAKGRVIASFLFTTVGLLDKSIEEALRHVQSAKKFNDERAMDEIDLARKIVSKMHMEKFGTNLDKLIHLPGDHALFLAAAPDMKTALLAILTFNATLPLPRDAHEIADLVLPQLQAMKVNTASFLDEFIPQFAN